MKKYNITGQKDTQKKREKEKKENGREGEKVLVFLSVWKIL